MKFRNNTKHRYKTIQGLRSFKDVLPQKIKRIIINKGEIYSKTLDNWRYLVGNDFFKICYPNSFKKSNKIVGNTLSIMVKRGHEVEIEYSKKTIIDKINVFFGYKVVEKIRVRTFEGMAKTDKNKKYAVTKNKFKKKIYDIKNEGIKNSLLELTKVYIRK